jgi:riboflavin kinase/FMN adenylyltransferase
VVGEDFRFGHRRAGDVGRLAALGGAAGFTVEALAPVLRDGERISSTLIRQALQVADFERAARLLGRPFRMQGRVVPGQKLGRTLGYPTANLRIRALPSPLHGIFAVIVRRCDSKGEGPWMPAVASLGNRPTVGGDELLLEVHVFDFSANLYGQRLQVEFVAKLRDELHFPDMETLQAQMKRDEEEARQVLAGRQHPQPESTRLY